MSAYRKSPIRPVVTCPRCDLSWTLFVRSWDSLRWIYERSVRPAARPSVMQHFVHAMPCACRCPVAAGDLELLTMQLAAAWPSDRYHFLWSCPGVRRRDAKALSAQPDFEWLHSVLAAAYARSA